jgi:hypothetical protein
MTELELLDEKGRATPKFDPSIRYIAREYQWRYITLRWKKRSTREFNARSNDPKRVTNEAQQMVARPVALWNGDAERNGILDANLNLELKRDLTKGR